MNSNETQIYESQKDEFDKVTQTAANVILTQTVKNEYKVTQTNTTKTVENEYGYKVTQTDKTKSKVTKKSHNLTQIKVTQTDKVTLRSNKGHPPQSRNALRGVVGREVAGFKDVRANPAKSDLAPRILDGVEHLVRDNIEALEVARHGWSSSIKGLNHTRQESHASSLLRSSVSCNTTDDVIQRN